MISYLVTSPLSYITLFLVAGYLLRRREKLKWAMYATAAVLALLFSTPALLQHAQKQWYAEYDHSLPEGGKYKYGVVLGGYSVWDHERCRPEHSEISDRLFEGIRLYKEEKIDKLLLASDGSIIECENSMEMKGNPEAMKEYVKLFGVAEEDIVLETKAWNTMENAIFTRELLKDSCEGMLLITSALHMRRSLATFRKAGIEAQPYITDAIVKVGNGRERWRPSMYTMLSWSELLHEWIGYAVYYLRGDI